jgi:RNA polymerase sigma-70 factor (ECF subfamily)
VYRRMIGAAGIEAAVTQRSAAFDALAQNHLNASYRTATLILRDPIEAEDATHDALVIAWRRWSSLKDPTRFGAWFGRILTNVCLDRLRQRGRRGVTDISDRIEGLRGDPDIASTVANRDALERGFAHLSPEHRVAVVLRYYLDLSVEQIADHLGIPTGTVKSRLHHALRDLGVAIEPEIREARR